MCEIISNQHDIVKGQQECAWTLYKQNENLPLKHRSVVMPVVKYTAGSFQSYKFTVKGFKTKGKDVAQQKMIIVFVLNTHWLWWVLFLKKHNMRLRSIARCLPALRHISNARVSSFHHLCISLTLYHTMSTICLNPSVKNMDHQLKFTEFIYI